MSINEITVRNAREHNLKSVSVSIPKHTLTVITGPSGSGKSSLAFDTIYVEGQRRYIESLSSYARQFLGQHQPPEVESISGLSPAIAINQKTISKNPRSTVGTVTEIYDYMRVLYARVGTLFCPDSGEEIKRYTPLDISKELMALPEKSKLYLLAPIIDGKKGDMKEEISHYLTQGFTRARIDGEMVVLSSDDEKQLKLAKTKKHRMDIVIDRILVKPDMESMEKRLIGSLEHALKHGQGSMVALIEEEGGDKFKEKSFAQKNISPVTKEVFPDLEPRLFSFNSPLGACPKCNGLGERKIFDEKLLAAHPELSLLDGAIPPLRSSGRFLLKMLRRVAKAEDIDIKRPFKTLPKSFIKLIFYGSDKQYRYAFNSQNSRFSFKKPFPGLISSFQRKYRETGSERVRKSLEKYMNVLTCPTCSGNRLNKIALSTKIEGKNIMDLCQLTVEEVYQWITHLKLHGEKAIIADKLLKEIATRLKFLVDVGLEYLSLNRGAMTLSGGEGQRIRLATQIGSALSGVLYVLDEPSIGLHQRDNDRLLNTLKHLRDLGNTILVVEHDEDTIRQADFIIDMGLGAGLHGGEIVVHGPIDRILTSQESLTSKFLRGAERIELPQSRKRPVHFIKLRGAQHNNLKRLNVNIPLNELTCITGVSGSGKSTLIHEVLTPAVRAHLTRVDKALYHRDNYRSISGLKDIHSIIELDQSPIGRTPKSNPATYSGVFDDIRKLFAKIPESQVRGYLPGRFSFNVKDGRCEECEGNGTKKIEMHFLPDVYITCDACKGRRYNRETLSIFFRGQNIFDILNMSIEEAKEFFKNHPSINRIFSTLTDVGLGYMKLGQSATTLSGGEAQRLKLSRELAKRTKGHCLYVLDEPTTGLHFADIKVLLKALHQLVDQGHTVIVIEHNLEVIKTANYLIDLGPEGGNRGGKIVAMGTPEEVAQNSASHTGKYLKPLLGQNLQ